MILDQEMELTTAGGQIFTAAIVYGTTPIDMGNVVKGPQSVPFDPAQSGSMDVFVRIEEAFNTLTNIAFSLVTDTDGAGGSEVEVVPAKTVLLAGLDAADELIYIGTIDKFQAMKRYLTFKGAVTGTDPTTGKAKAFLVPKGMMPSQGVTWG